MMHDLTAYSSSRIPVEVRGSAQTKGKQLTFEYELIDPANAVLDSLSAGEWRSWERADELWKTTCFEAFLSRAGDKGYWEFNFSPAKRRWNVYRFNGYRDPQPPRSSADFDLLEVSASPRRLKCVLNARFDLPKLDCSLTAVIRMESGTQYLALTHAADKPDFHKRESFTLKV